MELIKVILTALLSALSLFIITKILGHKQMAQLDFFDYVTGITIGSIAAEVATELEEPLKPLIAMIIYGFVAYGLTILAHKKPDLRKYINGTPTIILSNGKLYRENMKKAKLELSEFMVLCRQKGYFDLRDIEVAVFEYNGRLTILPKSEKRPATPSDLEKRVEKAEILTEIIMDGKLLSENLKRLSLDIEWVMKNLKVKGFSSEKEVFLALIDENKNIYIY